MARGISRWRWIKMSHNAKYTLCIEQGNKTLLDATIKYLVEHNEIALVDEIWDYYRRASFKIQDGYGITSLGRSDLSRRWGVNVRINKQGKIEFNGESMDACNQREFQKQFEAVYIALARRMVMAKLGMETQMREINRNGCVVYQVLGVEQ